MSTDDPDLTRVKDLYVGYSVAERFRGLPAPPLMFGDLVAFFIAGRPLSAAQQAALFRSKSLRDQFQRLKEDLAWRKRAVDGERLHAGTGDHVVGLPALRAAADDAEVSERTFDEGAVRLVASAVSHHVYVVIRLNSPASAPTRLIVESDPPGEVASTVLPSPEADGVIVILKDITVEPEALLLRLLRSPTTVGTFLA